MRLDRRSLFLVPALLALPLSIASGETPTPSLKISGLLISNYHYNLGDTPGTPNNQFSIDRVYLNFNSQITEDFAARVTTDTGRLTESKDQKLRSYLKYAYVEYKGLGGGLKLRFGATGTGFIAKHDQFVGQRWLSKAFTDQNRLLSSSDLGLHVYGTHLKGLIDYQLSIVNGGGYGEAEKDDGKTAQLRVTLDPLSGGSMNLPLTLFASQEVGHGEDSLGKELPAAQVVGIAMGFKHKRGLVWAEYVQGNKGDTQNSGYSLTLVPKLSDSQNLYARIDSLDTDGDTSIRTLLGVTHHFAKSLSAGLLYERQIPPEGDASHGVYLKAQTGF